MIKEFNVGEKYTNDQLRFALQVENLGGIRPSIDVNKNLNHLVILTTTELKIMYSPIQPKAERAIKKSLAGIKEFLNNIRFLSHFTVFQMKAGKHILFSDYLSFFVISKNTRLTRRIS